METNRQGNVPPVFFTFNFLASLINGNVVGFCKFCKFYKLAFNFLASLINGNGLTQGVESRSKFDRTFNFLASLINGNIGGVKVCIEFLE